MAPIKLKNLIKREQSPDQLSSLATPDLSQGIGSAYRLRVKNDVYFYVVTKASTGYTIKDIVFKIDPLGFCNQMRGGLTPDQIVMITVDEDEALSAAHDQIGAPDTEPKGKSKYYNNTRQFVREGDYMGNPGDQVYITKQGQGETAQYRLLNLNHDLIGMMFSSPEEAQKYASKKSLKVIPKPTS